MSYYIAKQTTLDFDAAILRITETLKAEGFGVLTDIDVQATLKAKIGADLPKYRILGACNPKIAHAALQRENSRGAHFREDFKEPGDLATSRFTVVRQVDGRLDVSDEPVQFTHVKPGETLIKDTPQAAE